VVIQDDSVSAQHAQFCADNGDYVQDLTSQNGTSVNGEHLNGVLLLQKGDIISVGDVRLEYTYIPEAQTSSLPPLTLSVSAYPLSGPGPLRLPSKPQ
jgi:pSer/pThr/pTyr-binding forkhead associated (FHA) protein